MSKIKISNGYYHYKAVPIFEGVKKINKEKALINLRALKDILDHYGLEFQLTFGTLLGAIREKDFIEHDEDIDLLVLGEEKQRFLDILPLLKNNGFEVARYDRRNLLSLIREGEYIDIYFLSLRGDGTRYCSGIILPSELIEETIDYTFHGLQFKIPKEYDRFLRYEYGDNWRTPIQWFDYDPSLMSKILITLKALVKEWLPDFLFFQMVKPSEKKMQIRYESKMQRYLEEQSTILK